jgi:hypothetical protein
MKKSATYRRIRPLYNWLSFRPTSIDLLVSFNDEHRFPDTLVLIVHKGSPDLFFSDPSSLVCFLTMK